MEYFLQHIQQNILYGLRDNGVQCIGQHAPVVVEEFIRAVLWKEY